MAYKWSIITLIGLISLSYMLASILAMISVIYERAMGQGNLFGVFKSIILTFVFAPL